MEPAELVAQIQAGNRDAEREMVDRYSRGVRFLLLELSGDPAQADDLHQETFRLGIEKVRSGELREPTKLAAFLRQMARNLFIAEYRKAKAHPRVAGEGIFEVTSDPAPSPEKRALDREDADLVRRLLVRLEPPRDREILMRFFVAEHSKEEICADLGLSSLHFNRVLHRARRRLAALVERHHERGARPTLFGDGPTASRRA
ncbi:MAG: sigma-70 family RNA polymerase sigma factor [Holophagales bacterium]|nr:sigma-70 family RNA polymerase sigma factor [Holophagales bacterium]